MTEAEFTKVKALVEKLAEQQAMKDDWWEPYLESMRPKEVSKS